MEEINNKVDENEVVETPVEEDWSTEEATYMGYITETFRHEVILFDEKYKGLNNADTMAMLADDWYHGRIPHERGEFGITTF